MKKVFYEYVVDEIQRRYDNNEITYEEACDVNNLAYDRYVTEDQKGKVSEIAKYFSSGSENDRYNSKFGQAIRKIDLLNKQLKQGKITKDEFDEKVSKIKNDTKNGKFLSKKGSDLFHDGARSNKNKPTMKPEDFKKHYGEESKYRRATLDDNTKEKIKRHLDICTTTDDYNEYQNHRRTLCKMLGLPKDSTLSNINLQDHDFMLKGNSKKDDPVIKDAKKLIHASKNSNLKELKPTFRSSDGVLYADKRTYFYKDKEGSRVGSGSNNKDTHYTYNGDKMKTARVDPELHDDAVYVSTNDKLKVKKNEKNNK